MLGSVGERLCHLPAVYSRAEEITGDIQTRLPWSQGAKKIRPLRPLSAVCATLYNIADPQNTTLTGLIVSFLFMQQILPPARLLRGP